MPKTLDDYQNELYRLFAESGQAQQMIRAFKKGLEVENDKLNKIHQKVETLQKAAMSLSKASPIPEQPTPTEEAPTNPSPIEVPSVD
jgi:uncharacterized coiled-coil DUF342 family protein